MEPIDVIAGKLRELDLPTEEIDTLAPVALLFSRGQPPEPTTADTRQLVAYLSSAMPTLSPVRQAIRAHQQRQGAGVRGLLATARTQVSLFGLDFWLVSALVTLVGAVVVLSNVGDGLSGQEVLLRASGPFLAYLGTVVAFRGMQGRVLECELVCLPSPLQLALARLVIVLGYDVGLGLALSLALWAGGAEQVLALTLSWLMPLFLVTGLALLLSLRLSVQVAASLAYAGWLAVVALGTTSSLQALSLTPLAESLLGGIGLALLGIALLRLQTNMHRLLPRF
jgi:hypothetical protein